MSGENAPSASDVPLPPNITLSTFTAARIKEIQTMRKSMSETLGSKMVFQKLPRHMRRRAMSHVVKRLPRRLREIHANQMRKSGLPPKSKKPSRRHRRRPLNLQADYLRRQKRIKWLSTHIWHAKRFHMIEKWGYKLPKQPCDKSFRACYRATTNHCLLQDLSYIRCIEILGIYDNIVLQLRQIVDPSVGLTFEAKCVRDGKKFGELVIFSPNQKSDTKQAIGKVQYFWNETSNENSALWLFVHPAYYKQILDLLDSLFDVELSEEKTHYGSNGVLIRELHHEIGRLRLTGSLSTGVLACAFKVADLESSIESFPTGLKDYSLKSLSIQNEVFQNLPSAPYLPPNMVLSAIVKDPRLHLPKKRTKAFSFCNCEGATDEVLQRNLSLSPLVNDNVRKHVTDNKVSNIKLCELRAQCLVPDSELSIDNSSIIPVILLWRPGNKTAEPIGYGSGWDIILPTSWLQSFFLSLVMWGARVGGLRESESIAFEATQPDILDPDSVAGEQEEAFITESHKDRFFRLPPNKRTNYNKFGITSPFSFNWRTLLSEWSSETCKSFSVLRDRKLLKSVQEFIAPKSKGEKATRPNIPSHSLIPVKVEPLNKGICSKFALICLPHQTNCENAILEPKRKDLFERRRKVLRDEHKNLLKKLRRRRKKESRSGKLVTKTDAEMLRKYTTEMRKLWLPEPQNIKDSCIRPVMGFVKHGAFSFNSGKSKGLGYIAADALNALEILPGQKDRVLIRNTNSRIYRLAKLTVIFN